MSLSRVVISAQVSNKMRDQTDQTTNQVEFPHPDPDHLYNRVKDLLRNTHPLDRNTAKLIIEYADDAIEEFGNTNQEKKVELREIKIKAEEILPPKTIEELKKRAEAKALGNVYPRNRVARSALFIGISLVILTSGILAIRQTFLGKRQTDASLIPGASASPQHLTTPTPAASLPAKPSISPAMPMVSSSNHLTVARKLYEKGEYQKAIEECDRILSSEPNNQEARTLRDQIGKTIKILRNQ